jgi:transposase
VQRAKVAGVSWPLHEGLDTAALERKLFCQPERPPGQHPVPDWNYVRRELTKTGVTKWLLWEEYREQHPDGYAYSQFCNLYRLVEDHRRRHARGAPRSREALRRLRGTDHRDLQPALWRGDAPGVVHPSV